MLNLDIPASERQTTIPANQSYCLLSIITTPGKAESMTRFALQNGAIMAHSCFAHGTVPNHILSLLGLAGVRRELVIFTVPEASGQNLMDLLCARFNIGKAMNGIAFLQNLNNHVTPGDVKKESDYIMIAAIVNEGDGESVVESARRCHPVGASILRALGSADHSKKTFNFEIFPKKEIVLIIAHSCHTEVLCQSIFGELRTEIPGRGILFSTGLERVVGVLDVEQERNGEQDSPDSPQDALQDFDQSLPAADYVALFAVVNRGHTGKIINVAEQCGGSGATILHVREMDSGSQSWYSRLGDAEKEIVLMLAPREISTAITKELTEFSATHKSGHILIGRFDVDRFQHLSDQGTAKDRPKF